MEDATGDSAVIEHVGGKLQIYHDRENTLVMTNDPPFDQQKELLSQYEPWGGDITLPDNLPGTVGSPDRFVRLEYYLQYTPEPANYAEAIANIRSLISSTNVPFGAPYGGGIYPTWWTSYTGVNDKIYFFDWVLTPNSKCACALVESFPTHDLTGEQLLDLCFCSYFSVSEELWRCFVIFLVSIILTNGPRSIMPIRRIWIDVGSIDWDDIEETLMLQPQDVDLVGDVICDFTTLDGEDPGLCDDETKAAAKESSGLRGIATE